MKPVVCYVLTLCLTMVMVMAVAIASEGTEPDVTVLEPVAVIETNANEQSLTEQELLTHHEDGGVETAAESDKAVNRYRFGQDKAGSGDEVLNRAGNSTGLSLGKIAISLAFVIVLVLLLGWAFKKLTLRVPGSQHMKVISSIPLGQRERLLVIEIQGKQRVLGVTPQQINFLFELEESLPEEKLASEFHSQLQSWLKK